MSICIGREGSFLHSLHLLAESGHLLLVLGGVGQLEEDLVASLRLVVTVIVVAITAGATGEVHVLLLDGHSLGVDGAQVGVLEEADDVRL